jgi:SAM-dependent methyltransferase
VITANLDRLKLRPGNRILDIGCGTGRHTCAVYQEENVIAIGADINPEELREAKNRLELHDRLGVHAGGKWGLCLTDTLCLPFNSRVFDIVICCEVIEHIRDHKTAVAELARVIKPGHFLVASVPRYWPEKICWSLSKAYRHEKGGHVRIYRKRDLIYLFSTAGFELRSMHYAHSLHTPYWWLKCLVGIEKKNLTMVNLYYQFLTWDIMKRPKVTHFIDRLLNPILGKSIVFYFLKRTDRNYQ